MTEFMAVFITLWTFLVLSYNCYLYDRRTHVRSDSLSQVLHQLHERLQRGGRHCFPPEPPSWGGTGCHELLHGW